MRTADADDLPSLLTAQEEHHLALAIEAGVLAQEALGAGNGSAAAATAAELQQLVIEGEAARLRFVEANLGLAKMVARQLAARSGTPEPDVFQEACLGLLLAVRRFDCRRGFRFATYALFWIRARAGAATAGMLGDLNLPTSRATQLRAVRGVEAGLTQTLGRAPTAQDVAAAVGRPERWVADLLAHEPPQALGPLETDVVDPASEGSAHAPGALLADPGALLSHLDILSRRVLELRLGFTTGEPLGYAAVARRLGVPVSRVRRLQEAALEQLRGVCPYDAVDGL